MGRIWSKLGFTRSMAPGVYEGSVLVIAWPG
jgi:hypothetical protein